MSATRKGCRKVALAALTCTVERTVRAAPGFGARIRSALNPKARVRATGIALKRRFMVLSYVSRICTYALF
jgi:hypothetical protein